MIVLSYLNHENSQRLIIGPFSSESNAFRWATQDAREKIRPDEIVDSVQFDSVVILDAEDNPVKEWEVFEVIIPHEKDQ